MISFRPRRSLHSLHCSLFAEGSQAISDWRKNDPGPSCPAPSRAERLHGRELNPGHETVRYRDHRLRSFALTQRQHGQLLGFRH